MMRAATWQMSNRRREQLPGNNRINGVRVETKRSKQTLKSNT